MSQFYNISADEMGTFLTARGFSPMNIQGTAELVWGKVLTTSPDNGEMKISLRIYTGINPTGESRERGTDAIRIMLFHRYNGGVSMVGKIRRCLRVKGWEANLEAAINEWESQFSLCPACNAPQVERNKRGSRTDKFMGCLTYFETGCNGRGVRNPKYNPEGCEHAKRQEVTGTVQLAGRQPRRRPELPVTPVVRTEAPTGMPVAKRPEVRPVPRTPTPRKPVVTAPVAAANPYRIADDMISDAQRRVEDVFLNMGQHIVCVARAGAGKTTMLRHISSCRKDRERWTYLAFGRKNAAEGVKKMPSYVRSGTTHSFCSRMLRRAGVTLDENPNGKKTWLILDELFPAMDQKGRKRVRKATHKLVGLVKNFAIMPGDECGIKRVFDMYTFDLGGLDDDGQPVSVQEEIDATLDLTNEVLELSRPGGKYGTMYNFDDMLWFPVVLDCGVPDVEVVLADEVQDFNQCQIWLLQKLAATGTRIIAVGDPFQAVFRFRGADCDAFGKVQDALVATKRGAEVCPLPTNYRCGSEILKYVRETTHVKDIVHCDGAPEGTVTHMGYDEILDLLQSEAEAVAA